MTNGEKIQEILGIDRDCVEVHGENGTMSFTVTQDWWNAEYKEPTTNNNLEVGCIDRKKLIDWINIWDITPIIKNPLIRHIQGMPSVTLQEPTNDLEVDAISREKAIAWAEFYTDVYDAESANESIMIMLKGLPPVTPQFSSELAKNSKKLEKNFGELDCISRADALDSITIMCSAEELDIDFAKLLLLQRAIKNLPSVPPQDIDYKAQYERLAQKAEIVISQLRADRDRLMSLPPATPIRPKGHWICDGKGRSFADYHCSECGLKLALCGQDIKQRQDSGYSLFCGGCGADMREVVEE